MINQYHSANLDKQSLRSIKAAEEKLGVILVALEPDPAPATLTDQQLQELKQLEEKTGKILVAYKQQSSQHNLAYFVYELEITG